MKLNWALALLPLACMTLSACEGESQAKTPAGQVVATIDGDEITLRELRAELGGATFPDPKTRKAAEQAAVQSIVARRLLANAAKERELDKSPDFALQKERATDMALVQALQSSIAKAVPPASREEAERFVTAHPDLFSQRKIFVVNQVRTQQPGPQVIEQLRPLDSLEEVEALFAREKIAFQRSSDRIDAIGSDPKIIDTIVKLPHGEMFAIPSGNLLLINQIRETRVEPFTGEPAVNYALQWLNRQRSQEAILRELRAITSDGRSKVQYNKDYEPPPAVKAPPQAPPTAPKANGV